MLFSESSAAKRSDSTSTSRPLAESSAGPANDALNLPISTSLVNIDCGDAISSALSKYRLQTDQFTSVLDELHAAIIKEKDELDKAREALDEERRKFHEGEQRHKVLMPASLTRMASTVRRGKPCGASPQLQRPGGPQRGWGPLHDLGLHAQERPLPIPLLCNVQWPALCLLGLF